MLQRNEQRRPRWLLTGFGVIVSDNRLQLRAGDEEILVVESDALDVTAGWLKMLADGHCDCDVERQIEPEHLPMWRELLDQLAQQQMLSEHCPPGDDPIQRYLAHFPRSAGRASLAEGRITVCSRDPSGALLANVLREHGLECLERSDPAKIVSVSQSPLAEQCFVGVCVWEQFNAGWTSSVNEQAIAQRCPCLFVDLSHGRHATVGPFFVPGEGACYRCYRQRWRENTVDPSAFDAVSDPSCSAQPRSVYGTLPAFRHWVAGIAAAELVAYFTGHRPLRTLNRIVTVDLENLSTDDEPCWEVPWCEACHSARPA